MTQKVFYAYRDNIYIGVYVATDEQFAETGLTSGGEPPLAQPTLEQQQAARAEAYRLEADPLYFMAQRGKATQQEWLDKIAEIETRFPYPEV